MGGAAPTNQSWGNSMKTKIFGFLGFSAAAALALAPTIIAAEGGDGAGGGGNWNQWGQNPQHQGFVNVQGQAINGQLADILFDPNVDAEFADQGGLLVHYQAPLTDQEDVFMAAKSGPYTSATFSSQTWHQRRFHWEDGNLVQKWDFTSDWKPIDGPSGFSLAQGWEPVYHGVVVGGHFYDPGFGGTIFKLNRGQGGVIARINPFGTTLDPGTYTAGPLTADDAGNVYYNVIKLDLANINPFTGGGTAVGSWLVKVTPSNDVSMVSYSVLVPDKPTTCIGRFPNSALPWPPSPDAMPTTMFDCGIARAGINVAPAIAPDGTIYTVARVDSSARYGWVIAVNPDLTLKWHKSMRNLFADGCGVLIPISSAPGLVEKGHCRFGAHMGVDPTTNRPGDGNVLDQSSSSPTVLPDGNVLYGSYSRYNIARGHLVKFNGTTGAVMATFDFGWDSTPAVFSHGGTYSIVIKDNHYDEEAGFYCNPGGGAASFTVCASTGIPAGPFYITQLNKNLVPEWKFHSIETKSCMRDATGHITCVSDHPNGFEWCINAPAIDSSGKVFANSEDGNIYVIPQGHTGVFDMNSPDVHRLFLTLALGAAYTPLSLDNRGRILTENDGHLFVLGNDGGPVTHVSRAGSDPESILRISEGP